jgi:hypothetical protein
MDNSMVKQLVDEAIGHFEREDISSLQYSLYNLYNNFNRPGGGQLITNYSEKDRLGECFCMCLKYDWMNDSDIREVWAEDGFYCIVTHLLDHLYEKQELMVSSLDLFLLLCYGQNDLRTKFNDVLAKGLMSGNPLFSQKEYAEGADYLIREFMFFAATILSPFVADHPTIISDGLRPVFENAKTDFEFAVVPVEQIIAKFQFISSVIKSILNNI